MRSRVVLYLLLGLLMLALGVISFHFSSPEQDTAWVFPAIVNRDCAPWDGAAFTVRIPLEDGDVIDISIWQAPALDFRTTFSFRDDTARIGNALLIHADSLPEELRGTVRFEAVDQEHPVQGEFDLSSATGVQFRGTFRAEWENEVVYCG